MINNVEVSLLNVLVYRSAGPWRWTAVLGACAWSARAWRWTAELVLDLGGPGSRGGKWLVVKDAAVRSLRLAHVEHGSVFERITETGSQGSRASNYSLFNALFYTTSTPVSEDR